MKRLTTFARLVRLYARNGFTLSNAARIAWRMSK